MLYSLGAPLSLASRHPASRALSASLPSVCRFLYLAFSSLTDIPQPADGRPLVWLTDIPRCSDRYPSRCLRYAGAALPARGRQRCVLGGLRLTAARGYCVNKIFYVPLLYINEKPITIRIPPLGSSVVTSHLEWGIPYGIPRFFLTFSSAQPPYIYIG